MSIPVRSVVFAVVFFFIFPIGTAHGSPQHSLTVEEIALSSLTFVAREQIQETGPIYEAGEWPTRILSSAMPVMVGVGRAIGTDDEATAFSTASMLNELASIYLEHPEFREHPAMARIPNIIEAAVPTFERYREGALFNFYPSRVWKGVRVRQPIDMTLGPIWKGFTNIPQDADTTSVVYAALAYRARIRGEEFVLPPEVLNELESHRDINRKPNSYNRRRGRKDTGAYMTWQMDEKSPEMPRYIFASPERGPRIPFIKNDVDCVVNLNVLRMLALTQNSETPGREAACRMINSMIEEKEHASCGIYYPNTFNLAFSAAKAQKAGESCIAAENQSRSVEFVLSNQSADGGWDNVDNIWNDRIQSTVFAMRALLEFGDLKDRRIENSLKYAASFLLREVRRDDDGTHYWKAETFFTATAFARSLIVWRIHAYTTALAASVLLDVARTYPQYDLDYYLHLN